MAAVWAAALADASYVFAAVWSALLGGTINLVAVVVSGAVLVLSNPATPGATVAALFRAEAFKILVIVLAFWLVLTMFKEIVPAAFFGAFVVTALMFRMALLSTASDSTLIR